MVDRPSVYLLDASVFIEANKGPLALDINPGFWNLVLHHCENGCLTSIDRVYHELRNQEDDVSVWAKDAPESMFRSTRDLEVASSFSEVMAWVNEHKVFAPENKAKFASGADGWLVAYAKLHRYIVVSEEVLAPDNTQKVKIPNVCRHFGVQHMKTVEMLRSLGVRFSWR